MNEQLEIKGDMIEDVERETEGFANLQTADEIAEFETWLEQGDFEVEKVYMRGPRGDFVLVR